MPQRVTNTCFLASICIVLLLSALFACGMASAGQVQSSHAPVKLIYAEQFPHIYEDNGKPKGVMLELAMKLLDEAGIAYTTEMQPWKRVYHRALTSPNILLCGVGRTPKREDSFQWVAPLLAPLKMYYFKRADSDIVITKPEDALGYKVGAMRGSYNEDFLVQHGFKHDKNLFAMTYDELLPKKLLHGRIQLLLSGKDKLSDHLSDLGVQQDSIEVAGYAFEVTEYLVASKQTPPETVAAIQAAFKKLMDEGEIVLSAPSP